MSATHFPVPEYLLKDGDISMFCFREEPAWNWYCNLCNKYATEAHIQSDLHKKNKLWGHSSAPSPPSIPTSTNAQGSQCALTNSTWTTYYCLQQQRPYYHNSEHALTLWDLPPSWYNEWLVQVREAGMFTSKTIVDICGGPDLQGEKPPHVNFLADQRSRPKCAAVKQFFGNEVFENLQKLAREQGERHEQVAPFGRDSSWAVVYTDGTKSTQKSALSPSGERGMWFPTLVIQTIDGTWAAWCIDAAVNKWTKAWEVHPSRLHLYVKRPLPGSAGSSTDPVSEGPGDHWTFLPESTVVIEELDEVMHGQR